MRKQVAGHGAACMFCRLVRESESAGVVANLLSDVAQTRNAGRGASRRLLVTAVWRRFVDRPFSSPRRTQLEPGFVERGTLRLKRLRRAAVIEVIPWNGSSNSEPQVLPPT